MNPIEKHARAVLAKLHDWRHETFAVDGNILLSTTKLTPTEINDAVAYLKRLGGSGTVIIFPSDVKARQGELTADSLQLTVQVILSGVYPGSCSGVRTPPPADSSLRSARSRFRFPVSGLRRKNREILKSEK
jgi:hypothetical protein